MGDVSRRAELCYRTLLAGLLLFAGVANALERTGRWHAPVWVPLAAGVLSAALLFADNVRGAWRRYKEPEHAETRRRIELTLFAALETIARTCPGVEVTALGASLWVCTPRTLLRRRGGLRRVERFRLSGDVQATQVRWDLTKGAVGRCCSQALPVHVDWRAARARWDDGRGLDADLVARLPDDVRQGFTLAELRRLLGKYAEVLAVPVMSAGGRCIGAISVDVPGAAAPPAAFLDAPEVEVMLNRAAGLLRDDLRGAP